LKIVFVPKKRNWWGAGFFAEKKRAEGFATGYPFTGSKYPPIPDGVTRRILAGLVSFLASGD